MSGGPASVDRTLVVAVVIAHYAVTLMPPLSAFLILRWRWFVWIHLPILAWAFSIPFARWPCPLTDLEKWLRARAGMSIYDTHFVDYYIYQPLGAWAPAWEWFNGLAIAAAYTLFFRRRAG